MWDSSSERPSPILSPPEIEQLLHQASAEERRVLVKRFGLDQDRYRTPQETAEAVGRTVEEVTSIEEGAGSRFIDATALEAMSPAEAGIPDVPGPAEHDPTPRSARPD